MSFEEKNLIKDLKKLSFSSFTPFVSIPEPSSSVSLRWREVHDQGGGGFFWNFEDLAATSDGIFSGFVSATNSLFMTDSFRKNSRQTFLLC